MAEHEAQGGDDMASIAKAHGFLRWETVWYHEENAALRKERLPHQLKAGDKVFVPELRDRQEPCATGREHVFQLRAEPTTEVHLVLEDDGEVLANARYELAYQLEGKAQPVRKGFTDLAGELVQRLPVEATAGTLTVWPEGRPEEDALNWELDIGHLGPVGEDSGVQDRLRNLGYDMEQEGEETLEDLTRAALEDFQFREGIEATGEADQATREALRRRAEV